MQTVSGGSTIFTRRLVVTQQPPWNRNVGSVLVRLYVCTHCWIEDYSTWQYSDENTESILHRQNPKILVTAFPFTLHCSKLQNRPPSNSKDKRYISGSNENGSAGYNLCTVSWTRVVSHLYRWFSDRQEWESESRNSFHILQLLFDTWTACHSLWWRGRSNEQNIHTKF